MYKIGIMGMSGAGKSTFSKYLSELGAYIIDADKISKELTKKGSCVLDSIRNKFGDGFFSKTGELNRKKLGALVFSDKNKLELLNNIMHGAINEEIKNRMEKSTNKVVCVDCPMLFKIDVIKELDDVILICADKEKLIKRIIKRDNLSYDEANARISSQQECFEKYATEIIYNNKSLEDLKSEAKKIMERSNKYE